MAAWYTGNRIDNFGSYPDPVGLYAKPDSNFVDLPDGTPLTVPPGGQGTVSGVRLQPWANQSWSITVKMDKPYNSVATHYALNYVNNPQVKIGQRVGIGQILAYSGNPYGIGTAFAFTDQAQYGDGDKNEPFSGTYINPLLNPVPYLNALKSGNMSDTGAQITVTDFMDAVVNNLAGYNGSLGNIITGHTAADPNIYNFMIAWAQLEGGGITNQATFNPLNTKQTESGSTDAGHGIQAYPDAPTGIKATMDALSNGLYPALVHALTTNDTLNLGFTKRSNNLHAMASNIASELMIWDFGNANLTDPTHEDYPLKIMQLAGISQATIEGGNTENSTNGQSQAGIDAYGNKVLGPDTTGLTVQGATNNIFSGLEGVNSFFSGLTSFFSDPMRIVKILIGAAMLVAGLVLLIKELGTSTIAKAIKNTGGS